MQNQQNPASVVSASRLSGLANSPTMAKLSRLKQWGTHVSIGRKITMGYSLAIGVAALGILAGQVFGELLLEKPAIQRRAEKQTEAGILVEFKDAILEAQSDITPFLRQPDLLQTYYYHLLNRADQVQILFERFDGMLANRTTESGHHQTLMQLQRAHRHTVTTYWQELDHILDPLRSITPPQSLTAAEAQALLLNFINSPAALQLEELVDDLDELIRDVQQAEQEAENALAKAREIKEYITLISLTGSIVMAIAIAAYLKHQITHPLVAVTQVAQKVTAEANFDLQAPITTRDEVGVLGETLNHLILRVKTLLTEQAIAKQQLEAYNYTLEQRVDERTEELNEKNTTLQNTLQELQHTQLKMIQSEKMSGLGQMVAGVAHEINNPVNFIHGNLAHASDYTQDLLNLIELYQQDYPQPTARIAAEMEVIDLDFLCVDLPKLLDSMRMGTKRIRDIVKSLRTFSRLDEAELKVAHIHAGIDSTLLILQGRLKPKPDVPDIDIIRDYGDVPEIECYPGQLNQVFMNLIVNAIDAVEDGLARLAAIDQTPRIHIQTKTIDSNFVSIRIKDNGPGIPKMIQSQLFDPFFTTKPIGKGTGLGLAISHQIIEKHSGMIECDSNPGQGTTFTVTLPISHPKDSLAVGA